jgi:alkylation response protein AidB-like acyl-CoA dehydrogenase
MNFAFDAEQRELSEVLRDALGREAPVSRWLGSGFDTTADPAWDVLARHLQALAPDLPAEHGGLGLSSVELAIVAEETGRVVSPAAFTASVALAQSLLSAAVRSGSGEPAVRAALERAALGIRYAVTSDLLALICGRAPETPAGAAAPGLPVTLSPAGPGSGGATVSGRASVPAGALGAQRLLVLAAGPGLPVLAEVDAVAAVLEASGGIDPTAGSALVILEDAPALVLIEDEAVAAAATAARDRARLIIAAQALGGARACLDQTVQYAGQRIQFDVPIGSFQAVKHRLADLFTETELAASAVYLAACEQAAGAGTGRLSALAALDTATEVFVRAARDSIQLHGGMGFTWEHPAHLYLGRALLLASLLGPQQAAREQMYALAGERPSA